MTTSTAARVESSLSHRAGARLQIASVCRLLPTPTDASAGTFILNRLVAMAGFADVRVVQPIPVFPALRPKPIWARERARKLASLEINHALMFYVPGVLKSLDGRWLARSIRPQLMSLKDSGCLQAIDAHFGYPEGVGCALVAAELNVPYFITIRGLEADVLERPGVREQLLDAMRGAAGLISVSHSLRDLVVARGLDPQKVLVAPNAVDRSMFSPGNRSVARSRLNVPVDEPLIVSVGHLLSVKRHTVLLDALAILRKVTPAKLVIIGGPSYEAGYPQVLREQVERLGLHHAVQFAGKLSPGQVVEWLRASTVFALASAREGCCNAVLEALATGVPVIATAVGDNPYFVRDEINGFLVPADDAEALARALQQGLDRTWDASAIAGSLSVGTWSEAAARVISYMEERVAASVDARRRS